MQLGFIGLGRMGYNMTLHLLEQKHDVAVYDTLSAPAGELASLGAVPCTTLESLILGLPSPRIIWLMVPAKAVDEVIGGILPHAEEEDILIDGGNSWYEDSQRRYASLKENGIHFLDCGTSGGMEGARHGACMMVGGDKEIFKKTEHLFRNLSVPQGYAYMGPSGSGHFTKMIHNAIEYGMMGAIAEGMQALQEYGINPEEAANVYAHGSIVEGRLMHWLSEAYQKRLVQAIQGVVPYGETEQEMERIEDDFAMPMLVMARTMRVLTREQPTYAGKVLAAMRNMFGGHEVKKK